MSITTPGPASAPALDHAPTSPEPPAPMRYLVLSGSLRDDSLNTRLARLAVAVMERHGGVVDLATLQDFDAPSYDQDDQDSTGFPPGPEAFRQRIEATDAFVIVSPEYNASMP